MKNTTIITVILVVIVGGGAFLGGMKYQQSKQPTFSRQAIDGQGQVQGQRGRVMGANRGGFQPVNGDIVSSDSNSITVKMADGSSKIVLFSDKTMINKADQVTKDDLKIGVKVAVFGQTNTDGSVTASNIQIKPSE